MTVDVRERLRKCLAIAEDVRAHPNDREISRIMADRLMAKYCLDARATKRKRQTAKVKRKRKPARSAEEVKHDERLHLEIRSQIAASINAAWHRLAGLDAKPDVYDRALKSFSQELKLIAHRVYADARDRIKRRR